MPSKLAGAVLVSGALALGSGGVAYGATSSGGTTTTPAVTAPPAGTPGTGGRSCTLAPKVLHRLERVDTRITTVLPKLQAAEQRATSAGHDKAAGRLGRMVHRLEQRQQKVTARISRIEQRCPGASPSGSPAA